MLLSGRDLVSLVQVPGLGSGTLCSGTGCQLAFISRCSLKRPEKKNEENWKTIPFFYVKAKNAYRVILLCICIHFAVCVS